MEKKSGLQAKTEENSVRQARVSSPKNSLLTLSKKFKKKNNQQIKNEFDEQRVSNIPKGLSNTSTEIFSWDRTSLVFRRI